MCLWKFCRKLFAVLTLLISSVCDSKRLPVTLPVVVHIQSDRGYDRYLPNQRSVIADVNVKRYFIPKGKLILLKDDQPSAMLKAFCDTIFKSNALAILYINNPFYHRDNPSASQYFHSLADVLGIPVITWDPSMFIGSNSQSHSKTLQISPTVSHQTQAMMSLLERFNWTDFTIVTTTADGYQDFINSFRNAVTKKDIDSGDDGNPDHVKIRFKILSEVLIRNTSDEDRTRKDLLKLSHTDSRVFVLYSRRTESRTIIECAKKLGLTSKEYVWILSMDSVPKNAAGHVGLKSFPLGLLGVWYDFAQEAMKNVLQNATAVWMHSLKAIAKDWKNQKRFPFQFPNLSCSKGGKMYWPDGQIMYSYLKNVTVRGTPPIQFDEGGQLRFPNIKILNLQKSRSGKSWAEVGSWTRKGLVLKRITWPGQALGPPKGKPERYFLKIATLRETPYVIYRDMPEAGECRANTVPCKVYERDEETNKKLTNETITKCCTGLSIDLLLKISAELQFDYELFEVEDGLWGAEVHKEWNGLVRVLLDKKADMVVTSLKINPERNSAVDFSVPYLETGITIIVSIREGAISPTAFLEPYDYPSWCLILVFSVHATGTSIFLFEWLSPFGLNQGQTTIREHKFSLFRSLWLIWAMLFNAAVSTDTPRGISSRFMANLWALFALVFLASYTANLAAFMITKEEYYKLSGIQDWRLQNPQFMKPPFKFGTIPNGSTETNIKHNNPDMYNYMRKYNYPDVEEGIKAVKKQKIHAFIYDATVLEYQAGHDKDCRLITVGKWGAMTGYGVTFPRGSRWIDKVNDVILQLLEKGEMDRLQKYWLSGSCQNNKKKDARSNPIGKGPKSATLGIRNFTSAFILLAAGISLGVILFLLEHFYFRFGRKKLGKIDSKGCCSLISISVGKSLSFQQSMSETVNTYKRCKCSDRLCHSKFWKVQHDLDLALIRVEKLQKQVAQISVNKQNDAVWRYEPGTPQTNGIRRPIILTEETSLSTDNIQRKSEPRRGQKPSKLQNRAPVLPENDNNEIIRQELLRLLTNESERESVI